MCARFSLANKIYSPFFFCLAFCLSASLLSIFPIHPPFLFISRPRPFSLYLPPLHPLYQVCLSYAVCVQMLLERSGRLFSHNCFSGMLLTLYLYHIFVVQILANLGMLTTDSQFDELMSRLHFHNGHMEYIDFVLNFGDPRPPDSNSVVRPGNHRVNAIRGDQYGMTAEEVEVKLRAKLRENFSVSLQRGWEWLCVMLCSWHLFVLFSEHRDKQWENFSVSSQ